MDLFLLYLVVRFSKPNAQSKDDTAINSFAHSEQFASSTINAQVQQNCEVRRNQIEVEQNKLFLEAMFKQALE